MFSSSNRSSPYTSTFFPTSNVSSTSTPSTASPPGFQQQPQQSISSYSSLISFYTLQYFQAESQMREWTRRMDSISDNIRAITYLANAQTTLPLFSTQHQPFTPPSQTPLRNTRTRTQPQTQPRTQQQRPSYLYTPLSSSQRNSASTSTPASANINRPQTQGTLVESIFTATPNAESDINSILTQLFTRVLSTAGIEENERNSQQPLTAEEKEREIRTIQYSTLLAELPSDRVPQDLENDVCPITHCNYESNEEVSQIKHCGHYFSTAGLNAHLNHGSTLCPVCRYNMRQSQTPSHINSNILMRELATRYGDENGDENSDVDSNEDSDEENERNTDSNQQHQQREGGRRELPETDFNEFMQNFTSRYGLGGGSSSGNSGSGNSGITNSLLNRILYEGDIDVGSIRLERVENNEPVLIYETNIESLRPYMDRVRNQNQNQQSGQGQGSNQP